MHTVPHHRPQGGFQGAPFTELSQTGAPREATDGGAVDHGEGDGGRTPAWGEVQKNGGEGDVGDAHQAP